MKESFEQVADFCERHLEAARGREIGVTLGAAITALEKKLEGESTIGATVYATLEPCTTRNHPKVPCAHRLIERKIARMVFGMIDPNRVIQGEGWQLLREANVEIAVFDPDLMAELEELNRDFTRLHRKKAPTTTKTTWKDSLQAIVYGLQLAWLKFDFAEFDLDEAKRILQQGSDDLFAFPTTCDPPIERQVVEHIFRIATEMKGIADRRVKKSRMVSPKTGQFLDDEDMLRFRADAGEFIGQRLESVTEPSQEEHR